MNSRRALRHPLALGLWLGLAPAAAAPPEVAPDPAPAEEGRGEPTRLDQVVVTGSHIPRIQIEGPLPISVVERQELLRSGQPSLADAIRDLPWNSFGSLGDTPNSDTPNLSLPQLRGLGSKYTLTLIDGQRLPGVASYQGGAAASVAGLPLAAIDRVEVLRDGASAVYGSDAIGGVINLVTRRGDTPPEFELQWEQPDEDGGEARRASFVAGRGGERGHLLLALEAQRREPLLGVQRDYLIENAVSSPTANPGSFRRIDPATGDFFGFFQPDPRCPAAFDTDPVFPSSAIQAAGPNRFCVYRFRDLNAERAGFEARSAFVAGRYDLDPSRSAFARLLVVDADGDTQLAPAPVGRISLGATHPFNPTLGERGPALGYPIVVNYRLTSLGPRVTTVEELSTHLLAGIEGQHEWADGGGWQLALSHNRYAQDSEGSAGYALRSGLQAALAGGRFNPFTAAPGDPAGLEDAVYAPWSESRSRAAGVQFSVSLDATLPFGIEASHAFGLDLRRDRFRSDADPATQAGQVLGQGEATPDQAAGRNYAGIYAELFAPLGGAWELSLAARYDRYQDAGGKLSPKLALAFRPAPEWLLRGSLGRGFQAPDLVSAYGGAISGGGAAVDPTECAQRPDDPIACDLRFFEVDIVPNAALGPERARQAHLGAMWQPTPQFELALDYVRAHVEGQIGTLEASHALQAEFECARGQRECTPLRDGVVRRDEFGNVERVVLPWINIAGTRTAALDLEAGARRATAHGEIGLRLRGSRVLSFERQLLPTLPQVELLGAGGRPRFRASLDLDWQGARHGASVGAEHIDGYAPCAADSPLAGADNPACAGRVPSHTELHAQWRWRGPGGSEWSLGGRNLRDRPPAFDPSGGYAYGLYDPVGRVWYLRYRQSF